MIPLWRGGLILATVNLVIVGLALLVGARSPAQQVVYDAQVDGDSDIFILDVPHRLIFNLTQNAGDDSRPVWSPDGRYIAFESWRDGTRSVYVMESSGRNLRRLTDHSDASEYAPQWTADGDAILFRYYKRPDAATFRARPDGSDLQRVNLGSVVQPESADDRTVSVQFVDGAWGVYVTEADVTRQLMNGDILYRETPQWSSDDHWIAFLAQGAVDETEVYVMDGSGNGLRQLTMDGAPKRNLSWRP